MATPDQAELKTMEIISLDPMEDKCVSNKSQVKDLELVNAKEKDEKAKQSNDNGYDIRQSEDNSLPCASDKQNSSIDITTTIQSEEPENRKCFSRMRANLMQLCNWKRIVLALTCLVITFTVLLLIIGLTVPPESQEEPEATSLQTGKATSIASITTTQSLSQSETSSNVLETSFTASSQSETSSNGPGSSSTDSSQYETSSNVPESSFTESSQSVTSSSTCTQTSSSTQYTESTPIAPTHVKTDDDEQSTETGSGEF